MVNISIFNNEIANLEKALQGASRVLITAPGAADGDSVGSQLALRRMILHRFPKLDLRIINDEVIPDRYRFLPDIEYVDTPETYAQTGLDGEFDVGIIVDGGIDRAGRLQEVYSRCAVKVFIDHHIVSCQYPYTIRIVEPKASATTELIYYLSQTNSFKTPVVSDFAQHIYLGLIFDTGFFRHSNTTPALMELAATLLRTGFDFTRLGERGMLERSFSSLQLLAHTLSKARTRSKGRIIWSVLTQETLNSFHATGDDREGIIDHLFLTHGTEVAVLFFELPQGQTKVSFRSHGKLDVAHFAGALTEHGGGHEKAAGALFDMAVHKVEAFVLERLEKEIDKAA